ncbi:MAG: CopG family transcriptional regulator [Dehalococcoidia bacterium]
MEKTTLYLPVDLQALLRAASTQQGRPQAELVREALTKYLADQPRPLPKSIGSAPGLTKGIDLANVDAWIEREMNRDYDRYLRDAGVAEPPRKAPRVRKGRSSR